MEEYIIGGLILSSVPTAKWLLEKGLEAQTGEPHRITVKKTVKEVKQKYNKRKGR